MSTDLVLAFAVTLLAAICGGIGLLVVSLLRARRRDAQVLGLLATCAAQSDPRVLLAWYPTAEAARRTFPDAFSAIEGNSTNRFPFGAAQLEAAHARWTTDWLEWERNHDAECRQKSEAIEAELDRSTGAASQAARTQLETLEREKLERYQRRYEEYVQISRALAKLIGETSPTTTSPRATD